MHQRGPELQHLSVDASGSWALPICHDRITSFETPLSRAAFQLKQVPRQLSVRPLAISDRG